MEVGQNARCGKNSTKISELQRCPIVYTSQNLEMHARVSAGLSSSCRRTSRCGRWRLWQQCFLDSSPVTALAASEIASSIQSSTTAQRPRGTRQQAFHCSERAAISATRQTSTSSRFCRSIPLPPSVAPGINAVVCQCHSVHVHGGVALPSCNLLSL